MQEAATLATSTQILMNVSEFDDVSKATDSLISSIQAFKYTAKESMDVVDILNTIGNNYAISTADLAESLTKSSGSLVAANGTLQEAVALTAAANTIIQDADVVGTALKTVAMRLRGTSVEEMEEEGLDTDGAVESKSKLQSKIKSLSGVNILTDAGAYKSTYQILSEIAEVWESINDMDQAALLELLAGKRAGSVMSAILQNPDTLKDAFESANNASGSALKENETYLDSIQGKMDLFTNAVQNMWENAIGSDAVKFFVEIGTWLIKLVDNIGLINSVLIATSLIIMKINHMSLIEFFASISKSITGLGTKIVNWGKGVVASMRGATTATSTMTAATLEQAAANGKVTQTEAIRQATTNGLVLSQVSLTDAEAMALLSTTSLNEAEKQAIINKLGLSSAATTLTMATLGQAVVEGKITAAEAAHLGVATGLMAAQMSLTAAKAADILTSQGVSEAHAQEIVTALGLGEALKPVTAETITLAIANGTLAPELGAVALGLLATDGAAKTAAGGFAALWAAMWPMLALMAGIAAIVGIVKLFDAAYESTGELADRISDLSSELSELESDIDSINSELETTQERMAELLALPSLSFVEQEELANLKQTTAELERQLKLKEMLSDNKEDALVAAKEKYINRVWDSDGLDKAYYVKNGKVHKDEGWGGFWNAGTDTKDILDSAIKGYEKARTGYDKYRTVLSQWNDDDANANKELLKQYGINEYASKAAIEEQLQRYDTLMKNNAEGVNMIFSDENFDDLEYGMSAEIDTFLDEMYAYQLKWRKAKGESIKSEAISSMFDATSTKEMQDLKTELQKIIDDDSIEDKNKAILDKIYGLDGTADATVEVDKLAGAYKRLGLAMDIVEVTAQDIADYFVLTTGEFDSSTMDGILAQYELGINNLKAMEGNEGLFNQVFDADGDVIETKIAEMMNGADETTRKEFSRLLKSIKDGEYQTEEGLTDWEKAIESFSISGGLRGVQVVADQLSEINVDIFPGLEDEIDGIINKFDELVAAVGDTVDAMDALEQARAEEAYSGSVSLETLEQLMQSTDNYADLIEVDETGAIKLAANAQEILVQEKIDTIKKNAALALSTAQLQLAEAQHNQQIYQESSPAQEVLRSALTEVGGAAAFVTSLWNDLTSGNLDGAWARAKAARAESITTKKNEYASQAAAAATSVADAEKAVADAQKMNDIAQGLTVDNIKQRYDSDEASGGNKTKEDVEDDLFQREMDYWENRIAANQAKSEQVQNEIDLMEKKGQKADASFYEEIISLENERKWLLEQQKAEAQAFLDTLEEGSEEWWEVANTLNDIEGELDDVTASIVDLQDAIGEIDAYKFEEFNNRLDNLTSKLETIRNLIAPNGEEDWFDDEGNWTESGVAVLGAHIQELEFDKEGLQKAQDELNKYSFSYEGNEDYYEGLGIHSEQEYYDKVEELTDQQYQFAESISDTEQSIVDMYESSIDAVEEYIDTLIDGYNDYIDSVKEALDAERDLYDFKKNVQKQAKDIAELERRIASLSGSTNAADIAERRKLEAQLYESRESLNDTYYDHAQESQQNALDAEQEAYEETMTKFVEGLRTSLAEATANMDEFLMGVTTMVMYNADTVLAKYEETNLPLTKELTNPWEEAKKATNSYSGNALDLMNQWTKEGGFFSQFNTSGTTNLTFPWSAGTAAATSFKNSVSTVMSDITNNIRSNVSSITSYLGSIQSAYNGIISSAQRAKAEVDAANAAAAASSGYTGSAGTTQPTSTTPSHVDDRILSKYNLTASQVLAMGYGPISLEEFERLLREYQIKYAPQYKQVYNTRSDERLTRIIDKNFVSGPLAVKQYAKGTLGTKNDQWAITDESWIGEEITLAAGKNGQLQYLKKGSAVMPADISANLVEWGKLDPGMLNLTNPAGVNIITNAINKPEINLSFDALVKAERIDENTLPEVKRYVQQEINTLVKSMNYAIKGKGGR